MGIVWEAYHKGVPLLGVPANSSEITILRKQCLGKGYVSSQEGRLEKTNMHFVSI